MPTDSEVLATINAAFGGVPKPDHFTNYMHCEECPEHDETLRTHDRDTLLVSHVDNPGWDPLCFTSPHGKAYYMPTLAKFALDPPRSQHGWYGDQLLFHLYADGAEKEFIQYCNADQRRAIAALLAHFVETGASGRLATAGFASLRRPVSSNVGHQTGVRLTSKGGAA